MSDLEIRPLDPKDDRSEFRSGNVELDRFFHRYAGQNQFRHHIGTTYVAVADGSIIGYATVSPSHIEVDRLPPGRFKRQFPAYPLPILRLARLAVASEARGQGVGSALLRTVFHLAQELSTRVGCIGVVVDAKAEAIEYYRRLGFLEMGTVEGELGERPAPTPMYLALASIPG